jgi:hypothetical protein
MHDKIEKIKNLLSELESEAGHAEDGAKWETYDAFLEMPSLISEIIEYLQPQLTAYEAAFYWHMFGKTIVEQKTQYGVFSNSGLASGAVAPNRSDTDAIANSTVVKILSGLQEKGVIAKSGEPGRDGTPYRVNLPEEIPSCVELMKRKAIQNESSATAIDEHKRLDFYNVKENRLRVFERDAYKCYNCGKQLTRFDATLDHLIPVSRGGSNSFGNLSTCCLGCNSKRRNRDLSDHLSAS